MATWSFKEDFWFNEMFVCRMHTQGKVYLVGDFNGWKDGKEEYKLLPCKGGHCISVQLREGFYNYKFSVNGQFVRDTHNPHVSNEFDNSVKFVNMDPKVYGMRRPQPPRNQAGARFIILNPDPPPELKVHGILKRPIFVYLPPSYHSSTDKRYPVVYAQDGQNLFSSSEGDDTLPWGGWYLDTKLDWLWSQGTLPEFILVAIPSSDYVCIGNRQLEYTCRDMTQLGAEPYVRYVTEFLKSLIDSEFRTVVEESHMLGASLGGLVAFLMTVGLPDSPFKSCACLSPAFWFVDINNETCFTLVNKLTFADSDFPRVYIDSGDGEGDNRELVRDMAQLLESKGLKNGQEYTYVYDECMDRAPCGVTHSEWFWRVRVEQALKYILQP